MKCRHCGEPLKLSMLDLGSSPPSNAYLTEQMLHEPEVWFPLRVLVCESCWLAQTEDFAQADKLFSTDYAYYSSFSNSWLEHAQRYVAMVQERFLFNSSSMVVEVAANDGYLLQYVQRAGIPCYGIEPTAGTAQAARDKGIEIVEKFFGSSLALDLSGKDKQADLVIANNVLAHVPDINDFCLGLSQLLKPHGIITIEFPHLMRLIDENQFDTVYHEHFSYLSLGAAQRILGKVGLEIFDVEELPTHGGSLRLFAQKSSSGKQPISNQVNMLLQIEHDKGLETRGYYEKFQRRAELVKDNFIRFLMDAKKEGKNVAAYGAAAKGNTLLNFAGIGSDLLPFIVDRNPVKQGKFMPGSRIPIFNEQHLKIEKPDYIVILPWNIQIEVISQLSYAREWNAQFVTAIPEMSVF